MTISLIFTRVDVWEGLKYILYFASNAAFQIVEIALWITTSNFILITWFLQWYLELNVDMRLNSVMKYSTSNVV